MKRWTFNRTGVAVKTVVEPPTGTGFRSAQGRRARKRKARRPLPQNVCRHPRPWPDFQHVAAESDVFERPGNDLICERFLPETRPAKPAVEAIHRVFLDSSSLCSA